MSHLLMDIWETEHVVDTESLTPVSVDMTAWVWLAVAGVIGTSRTTGVCILKLLFSFAHSKRVFIVKNTDYVTRYRKI